MAHNITVVPNITPTITPRADRSADQFKAVSIHATDLTLADQRSLADGGKAYVLLTKTTSGQAAQLCNVGNVTKAIAGEAIVAGRWCQPMSASGLFGTSSAGNTGAIGVVFGSAPTASGQVFDLHVLR